MENEISILDCCRIICRRIKSIAVIVITIMVISMIVSLFMPNIYRAWTVIMPLESDIGARNLSSLVGNLPSGLGLINESQSATQKMIVVLTSRTIAEKVILRLNLMPVFFEKAWDPQKKTWKFTDPEKQPKMEDAVEAFFSRVDAVLDKKTGTISITSDFKDPKIAAKVCNALLDELYQLINENAYSLAKKQRLFVKDQLAMVKKEVLLVGRDLSDYYKNNKISASRPKVDVLLSSKDDASDISGVMIVSVDKENLNSQIETLADQKQSLRRKIATTRVVEDIPQEVYLEYLTLQKKILVELNVLLHKQYELAKIEEAKEEISYQVIDEARVPVRKFKPKRRLIVMAAFGFGIFLGIVYAFLKEFIERLKNS